MSKIRDKIELTSYVTLTPVDAGSRRVTEDTAPFPDKMHSALGLCCANNNNFAAMSYRKTIRKSLTGAGAHVHLSNKSTHNYHPKAS